MPRSVHIAVLLLCAALPAGCAGEGSSGMRSAALVPTAAGANSATVLPGSTRGIRDVQPCSGVGTGSFNGVSGNSNVANQSDTVVVGGTNNHACDEYAAVVGGYADVISSGSNNAEYAFIGGGYSNEMDSGEFSGIVSGIANSVTGGGNAKFIGAGGYNTASADAAAIVGGTHNSVSAEESVIGGGSQNTISGNGFAVITGGTTNQNSGAKASIGGGSSNSVSADFGTIAGGTTNTVSGEYGALAGGYTNTASAEYAALVGGQQNTASGVAAFVGGGAKNTASGSRATVPGGKQNTASGDVSFAAGSNSNAATNGSFVWSDDAVNATQLSSTTMNQFLARATGGFTFYTDTANSIGATLAPGSGTFSSVSDRNMKTNIVPLDDAAVLEKVDALPISRWSYTTEHGVRHVGPMAQDFYAAFGVGEDDRHITSIDEDGVALAAIKALHAQNTALRMEVRATRAREEATRVRQAEMQREIDALVRAVHGRTFSKQSSDVGRKTP